MLRCRDAQPIELSALRGGVCGESFPYCLCILHTGAMENQDGEAFREIELPQELLPLGPGGYEAHTRLQMQRYVGCDKRFVLAVIRPLCTTAHPPEPKTRSV